ncbi:hypothetical protein ACIQPQ_30995 [Streptomyces sp. NPDC091281]|uniref:hypothetical protein n=1 Tax=Streptomyces sp. NPDC091281 TaxID=3365985 RepID=UPI00380BB86D
MAITVIASDIRHLLAGTSENPVLYVKTSPEGPELDVWDEAYVRAGRIVARRHEIVDWIGDDADDDLIDGALPEIQQTIDEITADL